MGDSPACPLSGAHLIPYGERKVTEETKSLHSVFSTFTYSMVGE